jgi:undecaprenyl-phosphate galactose phosphotransferase/putative colanic acid biosynthesis UDP-glucose lipid carrier transferase
VANVFESQSSGFEPSQSSGLEVLSRPRLAIPFAAIEPLFALADCVNIIAAGILGGVLYQSAIGGRLTDIGFYSGLSLVAGLTYVVTAHRIGLYRLEELLERGQDFGRIWAGWGVAILILAVVLFLFKSGAEVSRGSVACSSVLSGLSLVLWRRAAKQCVRAALLRGAIRGRRVILIGTQYELAPFSHRDLLIRFGLDEVERIVLPRSEALGHSVAHREAALDAALKRVGAASAEEIVLALSWSDPAELELLVRRFRVVPLPVRLLPDRAVSSILRRETSIFHRSYMIEVQRAPLTWLERWVKRLLDLTIATLALIVFTPVLAMAAVAIKLESKGPVIFRQQRHGFNGRAFIIYKFRTMKTLEDGAAVVQATERDPRVTRVGRILRQTSIDELPQLVNVLKGDMSIVGPRPHALVHDYEYGKTIANYALRHHVKPGITGWAQVQGSRGGTPRLELMEQRIALDLWYINNWSLGLDMHIMLKTFFELVRQRNAY